MPGPPLSTTMLNCRLSKGVAPMIVAITSAMDTVRRLWAGSAIVSLGAVEKPPTTRMVAVVAVLDGLAISTKVVQASDGTSGPLAAQPSAKAHRAAVAVAPATRWASSHRPDGHHIARSATTGTLDVSDIAIDDAASGPPSPLTPIVRRLPGATMWVLTIGAASPSRRYVTSTVAGAVPGLATSR